MRRVLSGSLLVAALGVANLLRRLYATTTVQPRRLLRQLRHSRAAGGAPHHPTSQQSCHVLAHTELAGSVVKWGATNKLDNASACYSSCLTHNQPPQPRGRRNCTSWVWNHDTSSTQFGECWLKAHPDPWSDMLLLRGVAKSWHSGIVGVSVPTAGDFTTRSCRGRLGADSRQRQQQQQQPPPLYTHPHSRAHAVERSLCPPVAASEASLALQTPLGSVRLRLNREGSPRAVAWIEELVDSGVCTGTTNRSRCAPLARPTAASSTAARRRSAYAEARLKPRTGRSAKYLLQYSSRVRAPFAVTDQPPQRVGLAPLRL